MTKPRTTKADGWKPLEAEAAALAADSRRSPLETARLRFPRFPCGTPITVLVLCTGNSARSILAECLINRLGEGKWKAYSAGSRPTGQVNPLSLEVLKENGYSVEGLRSKSWDEFAAPGAPGMDLVITVCDNAAGEVCPIWPGHPSKVHIGFPDPAAATGSHEERLEEFRKVYGMIETEVRRLLERGPDRAAEG